MKTHFKQSRNSVQSIFFIISCFESFSHCLILEQGKRVEDETGYTGFCLKPRFSIVQ